jgi:NAD(P)-dependent dehydrogenase (short-subunit alcohol dehydrogenase family)
MLQDRTILIAGAGPGLGDETAKIILREGGRVVLGARNANRLAESAAALGAGDDRVAYRACDIEKDGDPEALVELALERFGRLDGIVCVAACIDVNGTIETTALDEWRRVMETNVIGTVRVIQASIPALQKQGGSIVIVGSQSEVNPAPSPTFIAYGASKLAMHSATIYMAQQLGPSGVRVNRVVPSTMWTPTLEGFAAQMAKEQNTSIETIREQFETNMPLGEMPSGADVGEAIAFFLSERAARITGQELYVNSGEWMG